MSVRILRDKAALTAYAKNWHGQGEAISVVPTMGALHDGHLSLVEAARAASDRVIVTLFVNPKQFNNQADLAAYPRTEESDAAKLGPFGVDLLYVPGADQIYPDGFSTSIRVSGISDDLEGAHRPGHFEGVATVVAKLLLQTSADRAFFGEKDFQQLQVVKRLVADLDIPCEIIGCPTVRDADGLALSSRNQRLSPADRTLAGAMFSALQTAARAIEAGGGVAATLETARSTILAAGFSSVEYVDLRDIAGFSSQSRLAGPSRLLAAAELGGVRLIDNIPVG